MCVFSCFFLNTVPFLKRKLVFYDGKNVFVMKEVCLQVFPHENSGNLSKVFGMMSIVLVGSNFGKYHFLVGYPI